ncbi:MAG: phosphomannomutase [Halobacteriaceae archaeon]
MDLFGTAGVRGSVPGDVDTSLALGVGRAVAHVARDGADGGPPTGEPTVVVGHDARTTGPALAGAVAAGLQSAGATVRRLGRVATPVLAFAASGRDEPRRGVMVTASHNPPADNGLKLFVDGAEYDAAAERAVADRRETGAVDWRAWRSATGDGDREVSHYRDAVVDYAREHGAPLDGLPVVVDAGNGVAGATTPRALRALGAHVVALDANPDGTFPGRRPKPTPSSLSRTRAVVADGPAVLGVAHDGDGDRVAVLDGKGDLVHEDTVLAILAEHYVACAVDAGASDPVVVTTPNASGRVDERVRAAGGRVERTALGTIHEGVAAARDAGATVAFAGEPWKHCHPAFGPWLDGTATAAVLARLVAAEGLSALREPVTERPYRKASVDCPAGAKGPAMARLERSLPEAFPAAALDAEHGLRLTFPDGSWLLCRPSGTEPKLRLYVESDRVEDLLATAETVVADAVAAAHDE